MKQPETWREILNKIRKQNSVPKHSWIICGSGGGSSARSISGIEGPTTPQYIRYKCTKCGIIATKFIGESLEIDPKYAGLSCDDVIIKDIIE